MTIVEHNFRHSEFSMLKSIGFKVFWYITSAHERRDLDGIGHQTPRCMEKKTATEDTEQETLSGRKKTLSEVTLYQAGEH